MGEQTVLSGENWTHVAAISQDTWTHHEYCKLSERIDKIESTLSKIEQFLNKFFDTKIAG